MASDNLKRR